MVKPTPRTNSDGSISWRVQYRIGNKVTQNTFTNFAGADEFAKLVKTVGGKQAREVYQARVNNAPTPTLREWTTTYLDASSGLLTGIESGTRDGYRLEAERTFLRFLGDYPVNAITKPIVGKWVAWQEEQTVHRDRNKPIADRERVSSKTVRNAHTLLSSILAAAVAEKLTDGNPAYGVRLSKGEKREAVFLSPAEFETVLHFIRPQHRRLVLFLAGTGCRWGEATALNWNDFALQSGIPTIRITKAWKRGNKGSSVLGIPKTSKARRTVSLYPDLVADLGTPGKPDELVFSGRTSGRIRYGNFRDRVWMPAMEKATSEEACNEAGLIRLARGANIHDLRHSHASWLIAAGVPLPYIQTRLGHESITTTVDTYGHLVPDAHEQMAAVIAAALSNVTLSARTESIPELTR